MRAITGYFSPTAGRILVGGVDVTADPHAAKRHIGYLPEQVSLYPELTVRRFLTFVAEVRGLGGAAKRAAVGSVVEQCGLAEVADRLTGKLSKGYRQRVGLAQALVGDPEVLVLDEPTVGLDPVLRRDLWNLFHRLAEDGTTLLVSSHVMDEASRCDRLGLIRSGRLLAEGSVQELIRRAGTADLESAFLALSEVPQ
jgi:ABC-type multidrug transport system ATPase subunit